MSYADELTIKQKLCQMNEILSVYNKKYKCKQDYLSAYLTVK